MTNESSKSDARVDAPCRALTLEELLEFLKSQRPDVSPSSWDRCDIMTVLPWLLPAYAYYRRTQEVRKEPE